MDVFSICCLYIPLYTSRARYLFIICPLRESFFRYFRLCIFSKTSIFQISSGTLLCRSRISEVPSFSPSYILLLPVLYWCVYISSITLCTCGAFSFESSAMLCYRLAVYYVFNPSGNRKIACLIIT